MRSNDQSKAGEYQLWWNLGTKKLELHAVNCIHIAKLREGHSVQERKKKVFPKFQPFGQSIHLPDGASITALNARTEKMGQQYAPIPQNCAGQHYKGA